MIRIKTAPYETAGPAFTTVEAIWLGIQVSVGTSWLDSMGRK
jgi:hypothetical protein